VPRISLLVMMCIATLGFVLMAPYFAYVFNFLAPQNIVARLKTEAQGAALAGGKGEEAVNQRQALVVLSMERLSDIAINSISSKDKISATECVDALKELATGYLEGKKQLDAGWFKLGPVTRDNPDFASMTDEAVADLEERRTWLEWKVLRQFQGIYTEALGHMRDIDYVIAISTRQIGEKALDKGIPEALHLVHKFFNTYMRLTINARDVRTAYTILNQFRLLAERVLRAGNGQLALKIASHIKYYGHLSHQKKLPFVTETVAYDLGALCEVAHEIKSDVEADLLRNFLDVDRPETEGEEQEASLRGVRKAQVKLATFYLVNKQDDLAQTIWRDMVHEKPERMLSIRDELLKVESKDFWEVTDRGGNFDYLEPPRKKMLFKFFGWFAELSGDLRAVSIEPAIAVGREPETVMPTKNRGAS
jgi:hypothetical protein